MSKWGLLTLSVTAILVLAYFLRAAGTIRRSPLRDRELEKKLMHLPAGKRDERVEWAKNYLPERAVVIAVAVAVYLVVETVKAFVE